MQIDFDLPPHLIDECDAKIILRYPKYLNSWKTVTWNSYDWIQRIKEEVIELVKANNPTERKEELIDIINVARMMYYHEQVKTEFGG